MCPVEHWWSSRLLSENPAEDWADSQGWTVYGRMQTQTSESFCSSILPSTSDRTEAVHAHWAKLKYFFSKLKNKNNYLLKNNKQQQCKRLCSVLRFLGKSLPIQLLGESTTLKEKNALFYIKSCSLFLLQGKKKLDEKVFIYNSKGKNAKIH